MTKTLSELTLEIADAKAKKAKAEHVAAGWAYQIALLDAQKAIALESLRNDFMPAGIRPEANNHTNGGETVDLDVTQDDPITSTVEPDGVTHYVEIAQEQVASEQTGDETTDATPEPSDEISGELRGALSNVTGHRWPFNVGANVGEDA